MSRHQRSLFLLGLALLLSILPAAAGAWEWAYGPVGARDDAFRRVTPVPACGGFPAGYLAVGTQDPGGPNPDVYVVRTNLAGNSVWERTYDVEGLGLVDDGVAIVPNGGGGFVFLSNSLNGVWSPALTMIGCNGAVAWSQVYRDVVSLPGGNLIGNDLIVTQSGNPAAGTNVGDLAVAGFWRNGANEDAFLMRTTGGGAGPLWSQVYHVAQEAFNALAEATPLGVPTGDLVAVGRYNGGDPQGLAARVNGDNGTIGAAPQCMAQHGQAGTDETYNSVVRLQAGFFNQFAMVGTSINPAVWRADVWITRGNPCALAAQSRVGSPAVGVAPAVEQGLDIRQVLVANPGGPPVGSLAIAGSHAIPALGGPSEASLLFVTPGPLMPLGGASRIFGDLALGEEVFFSLEQNPAGGVHPPGYILAGLTQTDWDGFGDPQDMYLVHYDPAVIGCAQLWNPTGVALGWPPAPLFPAWRTLVRPFPAPAPSVPQFNPFLICP